MKSKMKSIVLALACAIAASSAFAASETASATKPEWVGTADNNWWNIANWDWGTDEVSKFPSTLESATFKWQINNCCYSATTINLGGSEAPIQIGNLVPEYEGKVMYWDNDINNWATRYDGGPLVLTNGAITASGNLEINNGGWGNEGTSTTVSEILLKDVILTCNSIEMIGGYRTYGNGRLTIDSGSIVTATSVNLGTSVGAGRGNCEIVINDQGVLSVPGFNSGSSPDTTLAFNGGTLKASPDSNGNVNGSTFVPSWMKVEIGEGGIVIDTEDAAGNSYNLTFAATNVTRASGVTIDGGLTKMGNGTLTVSEGQVWNGLTKILGGTLDLNGGTINGPLYLDGTLDLNSGKIGNVLILGGSGKIIDSSKENEDEVETDRQEAYEFNPDMWGRIGQTGRWEITSIKVSGAAVFASPSNSVLKSATAWYDPSDENYVVKDEDGNSVKALKNKSSSGSSMDTEELTENLPSLTTINNHNAIAFSGYAGFVSANSVSFDDDDPKGKSVFAVAQLNYENNESNGVYPIAMCSNNSWNRSGVFSMKLGKNEFTSFYRVKSQVSDGGYTTTEMNVEGTDTIGNNNVSYVMSLRGSDAKDNENYNVFSRIIGKDGTLDEEQKEGVELSFDEENPTWGSKDVISYGFNNYENGLFSNQGAVGEALAFARCLSDNEAETVQSYLVNKWVSSSIPATWPLTVGTLTLDGTADFDGANVTIGNLSGNGSMTGAASLKVTGTITATTEATANAPQITVTGDVDLTGATFAVDASLAQSLANNQSVTLLTSTGTITGLDSPVVLTVDTRRFKVRKSNGAITVTRLQPGLAIVIR